MTRFDHIAIAIPRMADAPPVLAGVLGGVPDDGGPSGVYRWGQWRFKNGARLEVLEPMGPDGFLHRFLAERGPGIHHVTFKVEDLAEACARARARGYEIVGHNDADPAWKEAFLHPRQALGIVVQLVEVAPGSAPPPWEPPPGPADPPPAVVVLGLRMRVRVRDRARAQWEGILGGAATEVGDGQVVYRWPRSPLAIMVEVRPEGEEGPLAIEIASDRPLGLPPGPHPVLGAVLVNAASKEGSWPRASDT